MIDRLWLSARAPAILMAISLIYIGALGVASTNFGQHWDEASVTGSVQKSFETGLMLPRWYNYPSVPYDVGILTALPHLALDVAHSFDLNASGLGSAGLVSYLGDTGFKLRLRAVFFLLSTLSGLAVYLLVRRLSGSGWIALFAALTLVASWEFIYHARWIAPDCLVLLFASFSLWAQHRLMDPQETDRRYFWAAVASLFAGLCMGSKYPGGVVLVPLLLAVALAPRGKDPKRFAVLRQAAACLLIAAFTFVLVTPGSVLEPMRFLQGVLGEMEHYAESHGGYTVTPGWQHFSRLATYLGLVFLSRNVVLAAAATALALAGVVFLFKTQARTAVWLLSLPIVYVAYMSMQRVMIVRNYLILMPFFAVFAALGVAALARAARGRPILRYSVFGAALALVAFNLCVATLTSLSIVSPNTTSKSAALEKRLASAPRTKFFLSSACQALLGGDPAHRSANVAGSMASADRFIFDSSEVTDWQQLAANQRGRYRTIWARMQEVNWDYYPSWAGNPRVLEVSARALKIREDP